MSDSPQILRTSEQQAALHARLVAGDPVAPAELAAAFLDHLIRRLDRKHRSDLCGEAAGDAIMALIKNPKSYDPARGKTLGGYLYMSAEGDLLNLLRKEKRHFHKKEGDAVELGRHRGNHREEEADPALALIREEQVSTAKNELLPAVCAGLSEGEICFLELMVEGERRTGILAAACGLSGLPKNEQAAAVKRLKDKLKKR